MGALSIVHESLHGVLQDSFTLRTWLGYVKEFAMLAEELPKCLCGANNYHGGGGCIGHISYTNFMCSTCGRTVFVLETWARVLVTDTSSCNGEPKPAWWGKVMEDYINGPLIATVRTAKEANDPTPKIPQLPPELTAYRWIDKQWVLVDREESQRIPVPVDPIRLKHDKFWRALLEKMGLKDSVKEIPNRYFDDRQNLEPWFELDHLGTIIRFGPRKRVFAIQVTSETPFECSGIAKAAKRDDVTFVADEVWKPDNRAEAKSIEVHAWGEEKFVSYFGWIMWDLGRTKGEARKETRP